MMHLKTYNKTEQVVEDRNGLRHNPRNNPDSKTNSNPRSNRQEASAVHVVGATEHAHIDVFTGDMAQDDTGKDSLSIISRCD